jgi:glycine/D-amino acid oxidase-like deaminating enzyme
MDDSPVVTMAALDARREHRTMNRTIPSKLSSRWRRPGYLRAATPDAARALATSTAESYWLSTVGTPAPPRMLAGDESTDLAVVGGGFIGLWTALLAKERAPDRDVVVIERELVGHGASGRNGGMLMTQLLARASLFAPDEHRITELEYANHREYIETLSRYGIDCDLQDCDGELVVALRPWQVELLDEMARTASAVGKRDVRILDRAEVQARIHSETFLGGLLLPHEAKLLNPAKVTVGLREACESLGVRIFEQSEAVSIEDHGSALTVRCPLGSVRCDRVALATYAHRSMLAEINRRRVPTYNHILATEPLTPAQLEAVGWAGREALVSANSLFHYHRLTVDNRILWGWVDGTVPLGLRPSAEYDDMPEVFAHMATEFFEAFPELGGVQFTHRWGGALDISSRRAPFFTTKLGGRLASVNGFSTGVAGSRFAANVLLDLLEGAATERTRLRLVQNKPRTLPYPPAAITRMLASLTLRSLAAYTETGKENPYLRTVRGLGYIV